MIGRVNGLSDLRTRIVTVLRDNIDYTGPDDYYGDLADAVIMVLIPESSTDGKSDDE
jgi:hypothetical protein